MPDPCQTPKRDCPWTFERTLAMGERFKGIEIGIDEIRRGMKHGDERMDRIEKTLAPQSVNVGGHRLTTAGKAGAGLGGMGLVAWALWEIVVEFVKRGKGLGS